MPKWRRETDLDLKPNIIGEKLLTYRNLTFALLLLAATAISWPVLVAACGIAWHGDEQSHILLILPVSVALIYAQRHMVFRNTRYSMPAGIVAGLLAAASFWMDSHPLSIDLSEAFSLRMFCFLGCCIAAFLLCYGIAAFRVAAFPLLFLFFMVPIPDSVLDRMVWLLQSGSTDASVLLLKAAHIAVVRDGLVLSFPSFDIEVARECSGIRSTITLFVVAVVLSHLFIRSNWRRSLLVLLVFPIAIVRNGLRIFCYFRPRDLGGSVVFEWQPAPLWRHSFVRAVFGRSNVDYLVAS